MSEELDPSAIQPDPQVEAAIDEIVDNDEDTVVAEEPAAVEAELEPTPEPMSSMNRLPHGTQMAEAPAPVVEPQVEAAPTPTPTPSPRHVVTNGDADPVYLKSCVYMNKFNKKSLTVHHVQRRLVELGYKDAVGDIDGFYGELTSLALKSFQQDSKLDATGMMDADTFTKLFAGDPNVEVVIN